MWGTWDSLTSLRQYRIIGARLRPFYPVVEELQQIIALDVDMICARLFILLQAPETFKKLVGLEKEQAQEMMDLLQKACLAFSSTSFSVNMLPVLAARHALFGSYL